MTDSHHDSIRRSPIAAPRAPIGIPGEAFVSNALINGRYVLRACIVNFHTTRVDVEAVPEIVARIGRAVDAELRPAV